MATETKKNKSEFLQATIQHIDITKHNVVPVVEAMSHMAFSARDLARASDIYDRMLKDKECGVILCLAGSLISAGLKKVFVDMIRNNMVDAIVSTGRTSSIRISSKALASSTTSPTSASRAAWTTACSAIT